MRHVQEKEVLGRRGTNARHRSEQLLAGGAEARGRLKGHRVRLGGGPASASSQEAPLVAGVVHLHGLDDEDGAHDDADDAHGQAQGAHQGLGALGDGEGHLGLCEGTGG